MADVNGKITDARIIDPMPQVHVTVDGKEEFLFDYYPDELRFTPEEFVGLTVAEARRLKFNKDVAYLRS